MSEQLQTLSEKIEKVVKERDDWRKTVYLIASALNKQAIEPPEMVQQILGLRILEEAIEEYLNAMGSCESAPKGEQECRLLKCPYCSVSRAFKNLKNSEQKIG